MLNLLRALWQKPAYFFVAALSLVFPASVIRYMALYNRENAPLFDDYLFMVPVAIATRAGTLSWDTVMGLGIGIHTYLFSTLTTIGNAALFGWDVRLDAVVSLGVYVVLWLALLWLMFLHSREALLFAAVPLSALVMSLQKDMGYVIGILSIWAESAVLFTLVLILLTRQKRPTTARLAVIILLVFTQQLAAVNGLAAWVVLTPALWFMGYRRWRDVALWGVAAMLSIAFYASRPGFGVGDAAGGAELTATALISNIPAYTRFVLTFLGKPFIHTNIELAQQVAIIGLVAMVAHAVYLVRAGETRAVIIWGTMALQGGASGVMISLGRTDAWGPVHATGAWYLDISLLFWAGLAALMSISLVRLLNGSTVLHRAGAYATIALTMVAIPFHAFGLVMSVSFRENFTHRYAEHADCTFRVPVTENLTCPTLGAFMDYERVNEMALYGLTVFSERTYDSVLPEQYVPGSPVMIETASHWHTDAVKRLFLHNLPDTDGVYVVPPGEDHGLIYNRTPRRPFTEQITAGDIDTLSSRTGLIWHVRQNSLNNPDAFTLADGSPMFPVAYHAQFYFVGHEFDVTAYYTAPYDTDPDYNFGDGTLQLLQWGIPADLTVAPCATLPIETVWATAAGNHPDDLHMTVVLSDDTGNGIARG
ncbi:MAG: hypothetical protein AAGK74_06745, partial [Chloroflexota bacterium]